jgi:microcystin-dependent protein
MKRLAILAMAAVAMATAARGETAAENAVPQAFAYQGVLADPVAGPLTGAQQVTFRLFADATGGDPIWSAEKDVFCLDNGLFRAWLDGEGTLLDAFSEPERFLELIVEGRGGAIQPRLAFTSVPQAHLARYARQSPISFAVKGDLETKKKLDVADVVRFDGASSFGSLEVTGDAEWQAGASPVEVTGEVSAGSFSGDGIAPVGSIAMWMDKDHIPSGWALCDGNNGTPKLVDVFPVGVGGPENYVLNQTGGADSVALSTDQIPAHSHGYRTASERDFHYAGAWHGSDWWQNSTGGSCDKGTTANTGNGEGHENRPPYLAVCFIMRVQ